MKRFPNSMFLSAVAVCVASCGYAAPYSNSGPSLSKEGVEISIAGERCYVNRSGEQFPTTVDDDYRVVGVRLQVENQSSHIAVLSPDRVRLAETVGEQQVVMKPSEFEAISLRPGETKIVSLDFKQEGAINCRH